MRIPYVDYAKAFAIVGVFIMHSAAPAGLSAVVSAYDMMVFFFLSGFVFSIRKYRSFWPFLWNKIRTLIIPGVFLSVVPFFVERAIGIARGDSWNAAQYARYFAGYVINLRGREGFGVIPWFLSCLFLMEIGGYVLIRIVNYLRLDGMRRVTLLGVVAVVSLAVGWMYSAYIHVVLPWGGDVAMSMFGFFVMGIMIRPYAQALHRALTAWSILPAVVVLVIAVLVNGRVFNGSVNPYMNDLGNPLCFVLGAIAGVWAVLAVSRMISDTPWLNRMLGRPLSYCGRNTLVFYCINVPIYPSLIPWLLGLIGLDMASSNIGTLLLCCLGAILINLVICIPCAEIMNRWLPGVLGRKKR